VQGTVTLSANVTDDNGIVLASEYWIDWDVVREYAGMPGEFSWDSSSVPDGDRDFDVFADDELSYYGYDAYGYAGRTFYVHNTAPSGIEVDPPAARIGEEVTISGAYFGREFPGETSVYFKGSDTDIEADVSDWTATSITSTVPIGAIDGPITVNIGILSGESPSDFIVDPVITNFWFTSPADGLFLENPTDFILSSQPDADYVEFEILSHPEIVIPDDTTPGATSVTISPADFTRNGKYTLSATAYAPGEQTSAQISFFVEKLVGDFNGDGIVNRNDLITLYSCIWARPGDANWIPYLDVNRNGVIEEDDASIVGYNYGDT